MVGLWKLAAMSAVIGAGGVVVWQAQQGLPLVEDPGVPTAPAVAPATPDAEMSASRSLTPTLASADSPEVGSAVANLSVPPEEDPFFGAAPEFAGEPATQSQETPTDASPAARYSRSKGLDFRQSPQLKVDPASLPVSNSSAVSPEHPSAPGIKRISAAPLRLATSGDEIPILTTPAPEEGTADDPPLTPVPEDSIQLTAGEATGPGTVGTPQDDPFFDATPPDLAAPRVGAPRALPVLQSPSTAPTEEPFDPFGPEPESARTPAAEPPLREQDPFEDATPPPAKPNVPLDLDAPQVQPTPPSRSAAPPSLPTDLDAFDPFPEDSAPTPSRTTAPSPLPLEDEPAASPLPATTTGPSPEFDPFDGAAPPNTVPGAMPADRAAPEETSTNVVPQPDATPEPASEPRETAPTRDPDLYRGDGEIPEDTPRGVQQPRLTIEKIAPATAVIGQPLIYSVIIKNIGGSAAGQVTVEDRIPKGTRLVGTSPQAEMVDKRLVWRKLGTLAPGDERKISIKVIPEEAGAIGSVAKVSFMAEVAAEIVVHAPKLKITVKAPTSAKVGEAFPLVFTISNPGTGDASNVIVRSILPDGLQHPAGNDLEYTIGNLAPNETREVRLEVSALKPGRVTQQTIVSADGDLTSESKSIVEILGEQLLLTRSGHDHVYLGRNAIFTNNVLNEGQSPVDSVSLQETIPDGFEFVTASHGGTYTATDRKVSWSLGTLAANGSATVSVTLVAKQIGRFDATVAATGPGGSSAMVHPVVTIEGYPALALEQLGQERLVGVGETLTTKIQLRNRGSAPANHVGLAIDLPAELKLVSATGPAKYKVDGQRLVFETIGEMAPGANEAYELVFEAKEPGDTRLQMQISADHLRKPVRHDEAVQVLPTAQ